MPEEDQPPKPFLDLEVFMLLFFAVAVGGVAAALTYVSGSGLAHAVMAGGAGCGGGLLWAKALTQPRR